MTNSRSKGKRGELEAAEALKTHLGIEARRGRQFKGSEDSPDLNTSLEGVHWEVKRVEKLNLLNAIKQSVAECGNNVPTVLHRTNRGPWLVTVRLEDLVALAGLIPCGDRPETYDNLM